MKLKLKFIFFFMLCVKFSNAQWQEFFSTAQWQTLWQGDSENFKRNYANELQTQFNSSAATLAIARPSDLALNTSWEFDVRLNFRLAINNLVRVYLTSNSLDLKNTLQGYFVEISGTSTRLNYTLKKQNGTRSLTLIQSDNRGASNQISVKIRVTRSADAEWSFYVQDAATQQSLNLIGTVIDAQFTTSNYFGIWCRYTTAARSNQFYFDNFKVSVFERDTISPQITSVQVVNPDKIILKFSEAMDTLSLSNLSHYELNGAYPKFAKIINIDELELTFDTLQTQTYQLKVIEVKDKSGNKLIDGYINSFFHIKPYIVKSGDIRINEIMFKPDTSGRLPNTEYVELWNTTSHFIIMNAWKWSDKSRTVTLTTDTLAPNSYIILCPAAFSNQLQTFGKVLAMSSFPSLNNEGDFLKLETDTHLIIDSLSYVSTWLDDNQKQKGGYALEWTGKYDCLSALSWTSSMDTQGGTPGKVNSVFQRTKSQIKWSDFKVLNDTTLSIRWNQRLNLQKIQFAVDGDTAILRPEFSYIDSSLLVRLKSKQMFGRGIRHQLAIKNIDNCATLIDLASIPFFIAFEPQFNEIQVSEIMVYPKSGAASYIEVYNSTQKVFNLKDIIISNQNSEGKPSGLRLLSTEDRWFAPQSYLVFTKDSLNIILNYRVQYPERIITMPSLPRFPSAIGSVWLLNLKLETIDKFDYQSTMHHAWLKDTRGVALERVSLEKETNAIGNFISAPANVGFGTPTYINAAQKPLRSKMRCWLSSKTVSPDADGFEDELELNFELNGNDWMAQMDIYNGVGVRLGTIFHNASLSSKGQFRWSPQKHAMSIQLTQGIYVLIVKMYNQRGQRQLFRLPFAVVYKN